jgi:hypothetical protein
MHAALEEVDEYWLPQMFQRQAAHKDIPGTQIPVPDFKFSGRFDDHTLRNGFLFYKK